MEKVRFPTIRPNDVTVWDYSFLIWQMKILSLFLTSNRSNDWFFESLFGIRWLELYWSWIAFFVRVSPEWPKKRPGVNRELKTIKEKTKRAHPHTRIAHTNTYNFYFFISPFGSFHRQSSKMKVCFYWMRLPSTLDTRQPDNKLYSSSIHC